MGGNEALLMPQKRVLHIVPPNGGGVDRYVRDLAEPGSGDVILHVTDGQWVLESLASGSHSLLAPGDVGGLTHAFHAGDLLAVHAHSTLDATRIALKHIVAIWPSIRLTVTLHDYDFTLPIDDEPERQARISFITTAVAVIAPSRYIAKLWSAVRPQGGHDAVVIPHGSRALPAASTVAAAHSVSIVQASMPIAVIGAIGAHKGLERLNAVAQCLHSDEKIVVIGYVDGQLLPGWWIPEKVWVHGAFDTDSLPEIIGEYGCGVAFFPNEQPESFCYALSDALMSGLYCLGPDIGAIGERLSEETNGATYKNDASPTDIAELLRAALKNYSTSQPASPRLTGVEEMRTMTLKCYEFASWDTKETNIESSASDAKMHLDGKFFRKELVNLSGQLLELQSKLGELQTSHNNLSALYEGRGEWIAKLESDVAAQTKLTAAAQAELLALREHEAERKRQIDELTVFSEQMARDNEINRSALRQARIAVGIDRAVRRLFGSLGALRKGKKNN